MPKTIERYLLNAIVLFKEPADVEVIALLDWLRGNALTGCMTIIELARGIMPSPAERLGNK